MKKRNIKKRYKIKKKKPLLESTLISVFFCAFIVLAFFYIFFVHYSKFQLKEVVVSNEKYVTADALTDFTAREVKNKIFLFENKSMFLVNEKKLNQEILSRIPVIKSTEIKKKFPNILEINIEERNPFSIWCNEKNKNECYHIDKEGVAFQKATYVKDSFFIAVKKIDDFSLGSKVFSQEEVKYFLEIKENIKRINLTPYYFYVHSSQRLDLKLQEGWSIRFSFTDISYQLNRLLIIIDQISKEQKDNLSYIDLRFGDRVYVK